MNIGQSENLGCAVSSGNFLCPDLALPSACVDLFYVRSTLTSDKETVHKYTSQHKHYDATCREIFAILTSQTCFWPKKKFFEGEIF